MKLYYYSFIVYKLQFPSFDLKSLFCACSVAFGVWLYLCLSQGREKESERKEEIKKGVVDEINFWNLCSLRARKMCQWLKKGRKPVKNRSFTLCLLEMYIFSMISYFLGQTDENWSSDLFSGSCYTQTLWSGILFSTPGQAGSQESLLDTSSEKTAAFMLRSKREHNIYT